MSPELRAAGRRRYVSLTTFRKDGTPVPTAVWVSVVDDAVIVTTGARSGKAKRLRRDGRLTLQECSMRGRVREGSPVVPGRAALVTDPEEQERLLAGHRRKYGWQYRAYTALERLLDRGDGPGSVVLRITDD